MAVGTELVDEGEAERADQCDPSDDLIAPGKTLLGLERGDAGTGDDDGEEDEADLDAHD